MTLPKLLNLLAEMETIEDNDCNVNNAIAGIKKRISELEFIPDRSTPPPRSSRN